MFMAQSCQQTEVNYIMNGKKSKVCAIIFETKTIQPLRSFKTKKINDCKLLFLNELRKMLEVGF